MRRKSFEVQIGNVKIGGNNPIAIQSMTNTNTADVDNTTKQIIELVNAGCELIRVTVNDDKAATAIPKIRAKLDSENCYVPIIGDFHYNGHLLLKKYPECAEALDKYRINPGNVGFGDKKDENFKEIIDAAIKYDKPIRIGVNSGSLDKKIFEKLIKNNKNLKNKNNEKNIIINAMVESVLQSAEFAKKNGLKEDMIVISAKMPRVSETVEVNSILAEKCAYALHLGLTEAGIGDKGIIASSAALAVLLNKGIGDTIRASLTPLPGVSRTKEVEICKILLQSLGLRKFFPIVTSCPGCGRTSSNYFQKLAKEVDDYLKLRTPKWLNEGKEGVKEMTVAVMGCIVNGPGESKNANIGISLPGNNEELKCPVYVDGKQVKVLSGDNVKEEFFEIIEEYVEKKF